VIKLGTILVLIVIGIFSSVHSQKPVDDALKQQLVNLEKQSWEAWKKRDGTFYQDFLSDDHVEIGAGGTNSKEEVVKFVGSPVCVVSSYSLDSFRVTIFDSNTAVVIYHAVQDTKCNGKVVPSPAWVSSFYIKRNGKWLNAVYQQSSSSAH
jgi:hypothetical protein